MKKFFAVLGFCAVLFLGFPAQANHKPGDPVMFRQYCTELDSLMKVFHEAIAPEDSLAYHQLMGVDTSVKCWDMTFYESHDFAIGSLRELYTELLYPDGVVREVWSVDTTKGEEDIVVFVVIEKDKENGDPT